jgi:hypothetical protein
MLFRTYVIAFVYAPLPFELPSTLSSVLLSLFSPVFCPPIDCEDVYEDHAFNR